MIQNVFVELSILILIVVAISGIMRILKQPLIIGYILSGLIVSPSFFHIVGAADAIATFAEIGVAFLLFMVGLNLNLKVIKDVGRVALVTGLGQVAFTSVVGFIVCILFGFSKIVSLYVAVGLTFSSTIIVMKLLTDKKETDSLYGKIAIGFLIVQDIIAIFILIFLSSFTGDVNLSSFVIKTFLGGVGLLVSLYFIGRYILPPVTKAIAKSQEFLLLFSIGWCMVLGSLFHFLHFSLEGGALLAGITLSMSPYRYEISSRMKPLRDFFIVMFFVLLGTRIDLSAMGTYTIPIILFSAFVLIGTPIIMMAIMGLMNYTKRNSFLTGITVAQISEFSLILIALGVKLGHLTGDILSFMTIIGLITIAGSSYFMMYSKKLYNFLSPYLKIFERSGKKVDEHKYHKDMRYDIYLFGYNRIGYDILNSIKKTGKNSLVIDYNPEIIIDLAKKGYDCRYGDASDTELLDELNFSDAKMIVSTIPDIEINTLLLNRCKKGNKNTIMIFVSHSIEETMQLYDMGASYVVMPHFLGGHHASVMIEEHGLKLNQFLKEKVKHIKDLKTRKTIDHDHPNTARSRN
jgi:Kef-type K+ transport system membrane component KefB|tara:strand:+ start:9670 stop:11394 length:1725 start_codon:yes stop_codon:yes gene_type:complete